MTVQVKCTILQINRILGRFRCCRDFNVIQKCFSSKWTHPDSLGINDGDVFREDNLEEKINADGALLTGPHKAKKRLSTKKELEMQHRTFLKRKIIEKKEKAFYGQKQPSILTWAALSQIKYLNKKDPIYWSPDMLAQSFPVSQDVIVKILKNNKGLPPDEEYILDHDRKVYMNWLKLKKAKEDLIEGRPVDPLFRLIVESEKLNLMKNAAGSRALPIPVSGYLTHKALAEKRRPKTKGEFSAILEDYHRQKETVKQENNMKHIELEDPNYVALLTGISEMKAEDDINEHSYQEQTTHNTYRDEDLFYDAYDGNIHVDVYKHSENQGEISRNTIIDGDMTHKQNIRYNRSRSGSFSENFNETELDNSGSSLDQTQPSDFEYSRSYGIDKRKQTEFQKNVARWMKKGSKDVERHLRKVKKY